MKVKDRARTEDGKGQRTEDSGKLSVAMGRKAVHTGQSVAFEDMLNDAHEFAPGVHQLTMDSPAPVHCRPDGIYPTPQPGQLGDREF